MFKITRGTGATHLPSDYPLAENEIPICVCCGVGVDSIAMLIGLYERGIRPDLITFADTGSEKPETYLYVPILRQWLERVGFPDLVVVRNLSPIAGHKSLYNNCFNNQTLPSIAFGMKSCSLKWKKQPQDAW
jgi:3'-phosphoadenosine 5'-phosphosulfate sulfotransferase (PAPS reductase)/FAD synthetase